MYSKITSFLQKMLKNAKKFDENFLKYWGLSGAKACKSCRSRHELSNEYLLAKIGVDTAENEPLKVWGKIQFTNSSFASCAASQLKPGRFLPRWRRRGPDCFAQAAKNDPKSRFTIPNLCCQTWQPFSLLQFCLLLHAAQPAAPTSHAHFCAITGLSACE